MASVRRHHKEDKRNLHSAKLSRQMKWLGEHQNPHRRKIFPGQCREADTDKDKFKVVEESLAGLVLDSSPVEFESSIGAKVLSQQVLTLGRSKAVIEHAAIAVGRGLDFVFSKQFAFQRRELWHALYSCASLSFMMMSGISFDNPMLCADACLFQNTGPMSYAQK
ncbi:hypothetical protein GOP47_0022735 [Adiantum capillus-veneris]|uniref:Uncharacterized protein n=1 Tax=Adiantum capillus-veneris TaxID=13818 RepID=A0A9D4U5Y8_ADICA|nr:hypothetical protein GOP47_0022735 [Adiantum capillus-veneris]